MAVIVRPGNLDADRALVIDVLSRHLNPAYDGLRFDWMYRQNPDGEGRVWIGVDTTNGAVVGAAAAIPRRMYVDGAEELASVLADFAITERYRSLGPALELQRACLADVGAGAVPFCYDFPSASMMAVYGRLRIAPLGQMRRLVKLLRVDAKVRELVKTPWVAHTVSAAGNLLLASRARRHRGRPDLSMSLHEGECGKEFSALAQEVADRYGVCVRRSSEYLNWRFLANPFQRHEVLTARREGTLLGYAVFTHGGDTANLVDLFGVPDASLVRALVEGAVALLRDRGASAVNVSLLEDHPWVELFRKLGFTPREARPVMVYSPSAALTTRNVREPSKWFLTDGDRDS